MSRIMSQNARGKRPEIFEDNENPFKGPFNDIEDPFKDNKNSFEDSEDPFKSPFDEIENPFKDSKNPFEDSNSSFNSLSTSPEATPMGTPPSSSTSPGSSSGFPSYIELNALHIIRWYDKPIRLRDMSTIDLNAYFSCYPDHMAAYIEYLRRNPGAFLPHEEGSRRQQKLHEALSKNKLVYSKTYNEIYDKKKLEKEGYRFVDGEVVCVGRKRPNNLGPLVINDWDNRPSQRTQVREEGNTMRHYWLYNNGPFFSQENRKADRRSKRSESVESQDDRQEKMDVADELETGKQAETKTETDTENLMPKNSLGATKGAAAKKAGPSWGFMSWANKIQQEREKKAEEAKKRTKQEEKKPKDKNVTFEGVSKKFRKLMGKKLEA